MPKGMLFSFAKKILPSPKAREHPLIGKDNLGLLLENLVQHQCAEIVRGNRSGITEDDSRSITDLAKEGILIREILLKKIILRIHCGFSGHFHTASY